jgi:hypothetical protein
VLHQKFDSAPYPSNVICRYVWRSSVVGDENMVWRRIVALVVATLLFGCAGVGIVETISAWHGAIGNMPSWQNWVEPTLA